LKITFHPFLSHSRGDAIISNKEVIIMTIFA
jgi:hypothetical protein